MVKPSKPARVAGPAAPAPELLGESCGPRSKGRGTAGALWGLGENTPEAGWGAGGGRVPSAEFCPWRHTRHLDLPFAARRRSALLTQAVCCVTGAEKQRGVGLFIETEPLFSGRCSLSCCLANIHPLK